MPRGVHTAPAEQRRRGQMHHIGIETAQHTDDPGQRNTERQRGHLRKHVRGHPVYPDAVIHAVGGRLATRGVRCDDQNLVSRSPEMLDHPEHRIGHAVDVREKGLGNDCNAHLRTVAPQVNSTVACGHMACEQHDSGTVATCDECWPCSPV